MRIAATIVGIATAVAATAIPARAEPPTNFRGAYIGLNAGFARGASSYATDPGCRSAGSDAVFCDAGSLSNGVDVARSGAGDLSATRFTGGIQGGYNWRFGSLVVGGEADFGAFNLSKSANSSGTFSFPFLGTTYALSESLSTNWLLTLRGRLGYTITPHLLLYATGGLALTDVKFSSTYSDNAIAPGFPGGTGSGSISDVRTGWTIGGGGELMLGDRWSIKAEYLYLDFGSMTVNVPASNTPAFTQVLHVDSDLHAHIARAGLNYRF